MLSVHQSTFDCQPSYFKYCSLKHHSRAQLEKEHEDPNAPELNLASKNWTRTIDAIEDHLCNCLGMAKIPLAYIIRKNVDPPADADDPQANCTDFAEELIARALHHADAAHTEHAQACKDDNVIVFNKLAELLQGKDCWTYMQRAHHTRNGRLAFMSLKEHCLGRNNVDNLATQAEHKLQLTSYSGETGCWDFEHFVKTHVDQHQTLTNLTRHGCAGVNPRSKVQCLLDGIKTNALAAVKTQIMASETLCNNFDACVNLFQDFVKQWHHNKPRQANLSALECDLRGQDRDVIQPNMSVEDRHYKKAEYEKLSVAKKKGLALICLLKTDITRKQNMRNFPLQRRKDLL